MVLILLALVEEILMSGGRLFGHYIRRIKLVFVWRACASSVPRNFNSCQQKIVDNGLCFTFRSSDEIVLHALWGCYHARRL